MSNKVMTVAVLGGGNGAFATAADLALRGFRVNLFEVPQFAENIAGAREAGGIEFENRGVPGLPSGFGKLGMVSTDPKAALADAEVILVVVPAYAQKHFAKISAPYLRPDQIVVLSPGNFGGTLEFARIARQAGVTHLPVLTEMECMIYSGFKESPYKVWASGFKEGLKVAALPGRAGPEVLPKLRELYPGLELAENVLETGLRNVNTVVHAPILVANAGRVEDTKDDFLFYWEGCTPAVGRLTEGVERERIAIGEALGLSLTPMRDVLIGWYGFQGAKGETLTDVLATNPAYEWDTAPPTLHHRFLLEDIPYGMVPMEAMGGLTGIPTPVTTAVITFACEMLGMDLRANARTLDQLGLRDLTLDEILALVNETGFV
jgi:opine dehydrogenase